MRGEVEMLLPGAGWYEAESESTGSFLLARRVLEEHQKDVLPDVHTPVLEGSEGI